MSALPHGFDSACPVRNMDDDVSLSMIRLWCEVLEDANPIYYDADAARALGYDGIVAPPPMVMAWTNEAEWSPHKGARESFSGSLALESPDFPYGVGLSSVQSHSRPLRLGERLAVHEFHSRLSSPFQSRRGYGCEQRRLLSLRDDASREAQSIEFRTLRMPAPSAPGARQEPALAPYVPYTGPGGAFSLGTAEIGNVLPEFGTSISLKRCIKWVAASRDYNEVHLDSDFARRTGAAGLYMGVHFFQGLVYRYVTDWTGPSAFLSRMEFTQFGRVYPGEEVVLSGTVAGVGTLEGRPSIDVQVRAGCDRGQLYSADLRLVVYSA